MHRAPTYGLKYKKGDKLGLCSVNLLSHYLTQRNKFTYNAECRLENLLQLLLTSHGLGICRETVYQRLYREPCPQTQRRLPSRQRPWAYPRHCLRSTGSASLRRCVSELHSRSSPLEPYQRGHPGAGYSSGGRRG